MERFDWAGSAEDLRDDFDQAKWGFTKLALFVAMGNAVLMSLLAGNPLGEGWAQIGVGGAAIILHGWAAWTIARGIGACAQGEREASRVAAAACLAEAKTSRSLKSRGSASGAK